MHQASKLSLANKLFDSVDFSELHETMTTQLDINSITHNHLVMAGQSVVSFFFNQNPSVGFDQSAFLQAGFYHFSVLGLNLFQSRRTF